MSVGTLLNLLLHPPNINYQGHAPLSDLFSYPHCPTSAPCSMLGVSYDQAYKVAYFTFHSGLTNRIFEGHF